MYASPGYTACTQLGSPVRPCATDIFVTKKKVIATKWLAALKPWELGLCESSIYKNTRSPKWIHSSDYVTCLQNAHAILLVTYSQLWSLLILLWSVINFCRHRLLQLFLKPLWRTPFNRSLSRPTCLIAWRLTVINPRRQYSQTSASSLVSADSLLQEKTTTPKGYVLIKTWDQQASRMIPVRPHLSSPWHPPSTPWISYKEMTLSQY